MRGGRHVTSGRQMSAYGRCPCGGQYETRLVEVNMSTAASAEDIHIERIGQGRCTRCDSRVYKAAVVVDLEALWHAAPDATR